MSSRKKTPNSKSSVYSKNGHPTGICFLDRVTNLLNVRNLSFSCDKPTEALGNCFCYAIAQQLHREEVRSSLSDEMKSLSSNVFQLRQCIINFVKNITPQSEYFQLIDEGRKAYAITASVVGPQSTWEERLEH